MVQDTSNAGTGEWRLFVAWKVADVTDPVSFTSYELYHSEDDITYTLLSSIDNRATNFYADGATVNNVTYYYKVFTKDLDGNQSYYSSTISGKADGVQGDGEGGGAGDEIAPTIAHNYETQVTKTSTTATITFTTTDAGNLSDSYIGYSTPGTGYEEEQGVPTMLAADGVVEHTVTLVGLTENETYHYKIKSRDPSGNVCPDDDLTGCGGRDDVNYVFTTTTDETGPVFTPEFNSATDVTSITDSSAIISWSTDEAANSRVDYGEDTSYGSFELNASYNFDHSITLSNLTPETTYHFKLTSKDNSISNNST